MATGTHRSRVPPPPSRAASATAAWGGACAGGLCKPVEVVQSDGPVAVSNNFVYFTSAAAIRRKLVGASNVDVILPFDKVILSLAVEGSLVYFAEDVLPPCKAQLYRTSLIGSRNTIGTTAACIASQLRTNSAHLFVATSAGATYIERFTKIGGPPTIAFEGQDVSFKDLAVDETFAYVVTQSSRSLARVPMQGGAADLVVLVTLPPDEAVAGIDVAGNELFFVSNKRIGKVAVAAPGSVTTLATGGGYRLAVDRNGSHLYFLRAIEGAPAPCSLGSTLYRIAQAGGTPQALVGPTDKRCITFLAVDGPAVYWTVEAAGGEMVVMTGK